MQYMLRPTTTPGRGQRYYCPGGKCRVNNGVVGYTNTKPKRRTRGTRKKCKSIVKKEKRKKTEEEKGK